MSKVLSLHKVCTIIILNRWTTLIILLHTDVSDFTSDNKTVTFPAETRKICTTFDITDDKVIENIETFEIRFAVDDPLVQIPSSIPRVRIFDDDGKLKTSI